MVFLGLRLFKGIRRQRRRVGEGPTGGVTDPIHELFQMTVITTTTRPPRVKRNLFSLCRHRFSIVTPCPLWVNRPPPLPGTWFITLYPHTFLFRYLESIVHFLPLKIGHRQIDSGLILRPDVLSQTVPEKSKSSDEAKGGGGEVTFDRELDIRLWDLPKR